MKVSIYWPLSVLCVCVCVISNQSTSKNHIMCQTSINVLPCSIKHTSKWRWQGSWGGRGKFGQNLKRGGGGHKIKEIAPHCQLYKETSKICHPSHYTPPPPQSWLPPFLAKISHPPLQSFLKISSLPRQNMILHSAISRCFFKTIAYLELYQGVLGMLLALHYYWVLVGDAIIALDFRL